MRALDPVGISRNANSGKPTDNPNEFNLLDLSPIVPFAGTYTHPTQGTADFGPYPAEMTERDAFRGPGFWNVDFSLSKRVRFTDHNALQFRVEAYNLFNHPNMFALTGYPSADVSSGFVGGNKDGNRRIQLGLKYEF
jgi:hypothetical protein